MGDRQKFIDDKAEETLNFILNDEDISFDDVHKILNKAQLLLQKSIVSHLPQAK